MLVVFNDPRLFAKATEFETEAIFLSEYNAAKCWELPEYPKHHSEQEIRLYLANLFSILHRTHTEKITFTRAKLKDQLFYEFDKHNYSIQIRKRWDKIYKQVFDFALKEGNIAYVHPPEQGKSRRLFRLNDRTGLSTTIKG